MCQEKLKEFWANEGSEEAAIHEDNNMERDDDWLYIIPLNDYTPKAMEQLEVRKKKNEPVYLAKYMTLNI